MIYGARPASIFAPVASLVGLSAPPADISLVRFVDRVRSQRDSQKCIGQALSEGLHVAGGGIGPHASSRGIWTGARVRERARRGDALLNVGTTFPDGIAGCIEMGVYAEDDTEDDPAWNNRESALDELEQCKPLPADTFGLLYGADAVRASLATGWPVAFAMYVDDAYERLDGSATWTGRTGATIGGHAQLVVGSYANGDFLVLNSWGDWGAGGYARFTEAALLQGWDMHAIRKGANL